MTGKTLEGGCLCGAVRYRITGAPVMASVCHCALCRRASAASSIAWAMFRKEQVVFDNPPASYVSSTVGRRSYCPACGTQLSLSASDLPGLIDITIGSLDDPEAIRPTQHYWGTRRVPWVRYAYSAPGTAESARVAEVEG